MMKEYILMEKRLIRTLEPVTSILLSFLIGALVVLMIGESPAAAFSVMVRGAFGSMLGLSSTIAKMTTLTMCGLSYAFAFRCGLVNIGAEGQMYMGALCAAVVVLKMPGPGVLVVLTALLAGTLGGALFGALVALLKIRFGANEVITTVMLNYVAMYLVQWAVSGPIQDPSSDAAQTVIFDQSRWLPYLPGTKINVGVFLWKTKAGFALQIVGQNRNAAAYAGISVQKNFLLSMFLAGAIGGLGGTLEVLGVQHRLLKGMASNYGFDGIAVALLGGNNPAGMFLSGILLGAMKSGGSAMQMFTRVPCSVVDLIRAMVIVFVLVNVLGHILADRKRGKLEYV